MAKTTANNVFTMITSMVSMRSYLSNKHYHQILPT
jgi:hypothetical protein